MHTPGAPSETHKPEGLESRQKDWSEYLRSRPVASDDSDDFTALIDDLPLQERVLFFEEDADLGTTPSPNVK